MPTRLRLALLWLVALALPMQAMASVAMRGCGDTTHGATVATSHAAMSMAGAVAAMVMEMPQGREHPPTAPNHHVGCSDCALCSVALAPPIASISADATMRRVGTALDDGAKTPVFLTDGPERPPRRATA